MSYVPHYLKEFDTPEEVEAWLNDQTRVDVCAPKFGTRRVQKTQYNEETDDLETIIVDVYYVKGQAEVAN